MPNRTGPLLPGEWISYTTRNGFGPYTGQIVNVILSSEGDEPSYYVTAPVVGTFIRQSNILGRVSWVETVTPLDPA